MWRKFDAGVIFVEGAGVREVPQIYKEEYIAVKIFISTLHRTTWTTLRTAWTTFGLHSGLHGLRSDYTDYTSDYTDYTPDR